MDDLLVVDPNTKGSGRRLRQELTVQAGGWNMNNKNKLITIFVGLFATGLLVSSAAAPAFAQDDEVAGTWDGTLERNGAQVAVAMEFVDEGGIWRGRLEVDGASSPMQDLSIDGDRVRFALPGQGVFDGQLSNDALVGSVSGPNPGSFTLKREEPEEPYGDAIESEGP
jgi:hypothetical protein